MLFSFLEIFHVCSFLYPGADPRNARHFLYDDGGVFGETNITHERHITWPGPIMTPSTVALGSTTADHGHNAFFLLTS